MRFTVCLTALIALLAACAEQTDTPPTSESDAVQQAAGPNAGKADGHDRPDKACTIVLRDLARIADDRGGFVSRNGNWVWAGAVDVDRGALDSGAKVKVLYRSTAVFGDKWFEVAAFPIGVDSGGLTRFEFQLDTHVFGPGLSGTALERSSLELIPFIDGRGRLFDHNRLTDDFAVYRADVGNGFAVDPDPNACPAWPKPRTASRDAEHPLPTAEFVFAENSGPSQQGALVAGSRMTVYYDLDRLPGCRTTHNGHPAWNLDAHVQFDTDDETLVQTVRQFGNHDGTPTNDAVTVPATFEIPAGARKAEVWFRAWNTIGTVCESFDSNNGANYRFDILAGPDWAGDITVTAQRGQSQPCEGGVPLTEGFHFEDWTRTQAHRTDLCFETWQPGLTDRDDPELWKQIDARLYVKIGDRPWTMRWMGFVDRRGDNARFGLDLSDLDPFAGGHCPDTTTEIVGDRAYVEADFFITANGLLLAPSEQTFFRGVFETSRANFDRFGCK